MSQLEGIAGQANQDEGEFIQVRKKSERSNTEKNNEKKKPKSRSRNNSIGEGKSNKARSVLLVPLAIFVYLTLKLFVFF